MSADLDKIYHNENSDKTVTKVKQDCFSFFFLSVLSPLLLFCFTARERAALKLVQSDTNELNCQFARFVQPVQRNLTGISVQFSSVQFVFVALYTPSAESDK